MSASVRLTIVTPTRNRAALASRAIDSVLANTTKCTVLVSNNSTDEAERRALAEFCSRVGDDRLRYVEPRQPLSMSEHWNWLAEKALEDPACTHVMYVTDRMLIKERELALIVRVAADYPDRIIVYPEDRVEDFTEPVRLYQQRWTGSLIELAAERLLDNSSRMLFHGVPRLLNCVVPRRVLEAVRQRFGTIMSSASPDFSFGFRALTVVDSLLYLDRAPVVHYALDRSNGASFARGLKSRDMEDFIANLKVPLCAATPIPELVTLHNAIVEEYCLVKRETRSVRMPELDLDRYRYVLANDIAALQDPELRTRMNAVLARSGRARKKPAFVSSVQWLLRVAARAMPARSWNVVGRSIRIAPPGDAPLRFPTTDAALEYLRTYPRRRHRLALHLRAMFGRAATLTRY